MVWLEELPRCLSLYFQDDNHESTHQKGSIRHLVVLVTAIVKESVIFVLRIRQQSNELSDELMHHGEVQWTEVIVECIVDQLLVN